MIRTVSQNQFIVEQREQVESLLLYPTRSNPANYRLPK